ncbi:unnamed protein product [Leuciscus chuanchicus]
MSIIHIWKEGGKGDFQFLSTSLLATTMPSIRDCCNAPERQDVRCEKPKDGEFSIRHFLSERGRVEELSVLVFRREFRLGRDIMVEKLQEKSPLKCPVVRAIA